MMARPRKRAERLGTIEREFLTAIVASAYKCNGNLDDNDRFQQACDLIWPHVFKGLPPLMSDEVIDTIRNDAKRRSMN